jgi:hypothetical protein
MDAHTTRVVSELRALPLGTQLQVVAALLEGLDGDYGQGLPPAGNRVAPQEGAGISAQQHGTPAQQPQQTTRPGVASGAASSA